MTMEELKKCHSAGGVCRTRPSTWEPFRETDIPEDLIDEWKLYLSFKDRYDRVLKYYGLEE